MKNAQRFAPPPIITVAVLTSSSLASSRRKSQSLKRSHSARASPQSSAPVPPQTSNSAPSTPVTSSESNAATPEPSADVAAAEIATSARASSDPGPSPPLPSSPKDTPLAATSPSSSDRGLVRKGDSEREMVVIVPLAIAYLEQVKLEFAVTKQHTDVRYVLTVHHSKLNLTWRHARSFDEYRKLKQRLLKLLQLGHFCRAECPWMFTFLKSYFPKKHLFNFVSARVIATRKAALERLFATTQTFLLNRANHCCGFLTAAFANELVAFIYGDVLQQYSLEQLSNAQPSAHIGGGATGIESSAGSSSAIAAGLGGRSRRGLTDSGSDDDTDASGLASSLILADELCQICDSSLFGEAFAGKKELAASGVSAGTDPSTPAPSLESESESESLELEMVATSLAASVGALAVSPTSTSSSWSSVGSSGASRRRATHYVTTLECGHQFHDECIVPKLNETLRCPTCGHLEIK